MIKDLRETCLLKYVRFTSSTLEADRESAVVRKPRDGSKAGSSQLMLTAPQEILDDNKFKEVKFAAKTDN